MFTAFYIIWIAKQFWKKGRIRKNQYQKKNKVMTKESEIHFQQCPYKILEAKESTTISKLTGRISIIFC
jgi:hypothetical protein